MARLSAALLVCMAALSGCSDSTETSDRGARASQASEPRSSVSARSEQPGKDDGTAAPAPSPTDPGSEPPKTVPPDLADIEQGPSDEEVRPLFEACQREREEAKTPEERERARRTCDRAHAESARNSESLASHGNLEIVSEDDLQAWWPHRPLLERKDEGRIVLGAWSERGGRKGDPSRPHAAAIAFFERGDSSVKRDTLEEFVEAGGLILTAYSPATQYEALPFGGEQRPVEVRGSTGLMRTTRNSQTDRTYRRLSWREPQSTGDGPIPFDVVSSGDLYSDDQAVAFANSVRPS